MLMVIDIIGIFTSSSSSFCSLILLFLFTILAVDRKYEADEQASRQNYESEKQIIYDMIKEDIEEKLRRLEEDRHNLATSDLWQVS